MSPRALITGIGAAALTFGAIVGGAATTPLAYAQETQTAQIDDQRAAAEAEQAAAYEAFVASLAAELGSDEVAVDTAIREALKEQIAEQLAGGDISEEEAAARTAVIDVTAAPLGGHGFGGHGFDGPGFGRPGGPRDGDHGGSPRADDVQDDDADAEEAAAATDEETDATPEA